MTISQTNEPKEHLNPGIFALRLPADDRTPRDGRTTVIVTGVGRSGTSMVAKLVDTLGITMGKTQGLAVYEDREINAALYQLDHTRLRRLIHENDTARPRWGFKFASLQNHIFPPQLGYFRNPHLIVVMRDPIATASRSHISDGAPQPFEETLGNVTRQAADMAVFIKNASCPTLLLSYEKFVISPDMGIDSVAQFCGITVSDELRIRARAAIEPNNPQYIKLFHSKYNGNFDSVKRGQVLGWCAIEDDPRPVDVEFVADGLVLDVARADIFRSDLLAAGIGRGAHGFCFDISGLGLKDAAVLQVRVMGVGDIVKRSGRRLGDFPDR